MTLPALDRAALIVIDVQRAFCDAGGSLARGGGEHRHCAAAVPTVTRLLDAWRTTSRPGVLARYVLAADGGDAGLLAERSPPLPVPGALRAGTADAALLPELAPRDGERIIDKTRFSAFQATGLEEHLAGLGVDTVVLCGFTTNVCVDSTARDAFARDLRLVVAADACASTHPDLHDASLRTIELCMGDVAATDTIVPPPAHAASRGAP